MDGVERERVLCLENVDPPSPYQPLSLSQSHPVMSHSVTSHTLFRALLIVLVYTNYVSSLN